MNIETIYDIHWIQKETIIHVILEAYACRKFFGIQKVYHQNNSERKQCKLNNYDDKLSVIRSTKK